MASRELLDGRYWNVTSDSSGRVDDFTSEMASLANPIDYYPMLFPTLKLIDCQVRKFNRDKPHNLAIRRTLQCLGLPSRAPPIACALPDGDSDEQVIF